MLIIIIIFFSKFLNDLFVICVLDTSSVLQEGVPEEEMADKDDDEDDDAALKVAEADVTHPSVAPRWVREKPFNCVQTND